MSNTKEFRSGDERNKRQDKIYDNCFSNDMFYRELTRDGRRFCAVAALLEELLVLAVFGIRISTSPAPVLAFLWVLFAILTAAALIGADWLAEQFGRYRTASGASDRAGTYRSAKMAPADSSESRDRHMSRSQRIAA